MQESVEEIKERLFKWNNYQRVKLSNEYVKKTLLSKMDTLRFLTLFEAFNKPLKAWGSNENY